MKVTKIYTAGDPAGVQPVLPKLCPIAAGWPSPAEDFIEDTLNLHTLLVRNPASTYLIEVMGESMIGVGIMNKDIYE